MTYEETLNAVMEKVAAPRKATRRDLANLFPKQRLLEQSKAQAAAATRELQAANPIKEVATPKGISFKYTPPVSPEAREAMRMLDSLRGNRPLLDKMTALTEKKQLLDRGFVPTRSLLHRTKLNPSFGLDGGPLFRNLGWWGEIKQNQKYLDLLQSDPKKYAQEIAAISAGNKYNPSVRRMLDNIDARAIEDAKGRSSRARAKVLQAARKAQSKAQIAANRAAKAYRTNPSLDTLNNMLDTRHAARQQSIRAARIEHTRIAPELPAAQKKTLSDFLANAGDMARPKVSPDLLPALAKANPDVLPALLKQKANLAPLKFKGSPSRYRNLHGAVAAAVPLAMTLGGGAIGGILGSKASKKYKD